jgi:prepilin-type processing-associated H-X9-DG protein
MIAVVYSGSKTAIWKIAREGKVIAECSMPGINPCFVDQKALLQQLNKKTILINHAEQIKKIYAFAAGATSAERKNELAKSLGLFFKHSKITVQGDLYGAARAACYHEKGIVCILGSGANCSYFDGHELEENNFGLGFILGDEGSANYLGKIILKNFLQEKLPLALQRKFSEKYDLDRTGILEKVYKKTMAQQFLSSFLEFFIENSAHEYIQELLDHAFERYFELYLLPTMKQHPENDVHFVGIVAGTFQERLRLSAQKRGITITTITKEPIYNLLNYYSN